MRRSGRRDRLPARYATSRRSGAARCSRSPARWCRADVGKDVNLLPVAWVMRPGAGACQLDDEARNQTFERGAVVADVDPVRLVERHGDASQGRGGEAKRPLDHLVEVAHDGRAAPESGVDERHQGVHPLHVPFAGDQRVRNFRNDGGGCHRSHFRRRSREQRQMVSKLVQDAAPDGNELAQLGTYVVSIGWSGQPERSSRRSSSKQVSHPPAVQDPCLRLVNRQQLDRPSTDRLASRRRSRYKRPPPCSGPSTVFQLALLLAVAATAARAAGARSATNARPPPTATRTVRARATPRSRAATARSRAATRLSCPEEAVCMRYFPAQFLTKPVRPHQTRTSTRHRLRGRRDLPRRRAVRAAVDRASLLREELLQRRRLPGGLRVPAGGNAWQHGADPRSRTRSCTSARRDVRTPKAAARNRTRRGRQPGMRRAAWAARLVPDPDLAARRPRARRRPSTASSTSTRPRSACSACCPESAPPRRRRSSPTGSGIRSVPSTSWCASRASAARWSGACAPTSRSRDRPPRPAPSRRRRRRAPAARAPRRRARRPRRSDPSPHLCPPRGKARHRDARRARHTAFVRVPPERRSGACGASPSALRGTAGRTGGAVALQSSRTTYDSDDALS